MLDDAAGQASKALAGDSTNRTRVVRFFDGMVKLLID